MTNKFKYKILSDIGLILEFWQGDFTFSEIIEFKTLEAKDTEWRDYYNVLADDRQANKQLHNLNKTSPEEKEKNFNQSQKFVKKRKTALLTSTPSQVVTSVLLKRDKNPKAFVQLEVFSTVDGALKWLDVDAMELERINKLLEEMKNE